MQYGIKQYIFVIRELTAREIKRKYSRSVLGIVWSVLNPLLFMIIIGAVFGRITNYPNYPVYYIAGYTFWTMFNVGTITSMSVFVDNKFLLQKTKLPREVFVLSRVYTSLVNLLFSCVALFIAIIVYDCWINWMIVVFVIDIVFEFIFSVGVSFILATIYVFYRDIKFIWGNFLIYLVHMVAIYLPVELYPSSLQAITMINPIYIYPDIARRCILEEKVAANELGMMVVWAIISILVGILTFKFFENEIVKKV